MAIQKVDNKRVDILTGSQTLTGSYADLGNIDAGPFINVQDCESVTLWLKLTINNSTGIKIKMLFKESEAATDLYQPVIKTVTATAVTVAPQEIVLANDSTQNLGITFSVGDQLEFIKFQIIATVVGATPASVTDCGVTFTSNI